MSDHHHNHPASTRTSTPLARPPIAASSSRPPSPFQRPLAAPMHFTRQQQQQQQQHGATSNHSSVNSSSGNLAPVHHRNIHNNNNNNNNNSSSTGGIIVLPSLHPNPLMTRPSTPQQQQQAVPVVAPVTPSNDINNHSSSVAALPLTGKALDHWLNLQAQAVSVVHISSNNNAIIATTTTATIRTPSPSPRNPLVITSTKTAATSGTAAGSSTLASGGATATSTITAAEDAATAETAATATGSSAPSSTNMTAADQNHHQHHHPAINPHHLVAVAVAAASSMSPGARRHGAILLHDGVPPRPPKSLAEIEAEEKAGREEILREAASTNFVELALGIACLQRTEACLASKIGGEEYALFVQRVMSQQRQLSDPQKRPATIPSAAAVAPTVPALFKRVMLTIKELGDALVKKPPEIPVSTRTTQVDFLTFPWMQNEFHSAEETNRLRILLAAADARSVLDTAFFSAMQTLALAELAESSDLLESANASLAEESKKRMQLEVEQLVTSKKSLHAKQVAAEMSEELRREKESVDSEREARVGMEKALEEVNAEVDAKTLSQTQLQTQAARAKHQQAATKFATMDHATQVGGGGGGSRSAKECGELVLNAKLVPHANELISFHAESQRCVVRSDTIERAAVQVELLAVGGPTLNIYKDINSIIGQSSSSNNRRNNNNNNNLATSSSSTTFSLLVAAITPPLLSAKVANIASIQRLLEKDNNGVRLVIGTGGSSATSQQQQQLEASSSLSPSAFALSSSLSLRPAASSAAFQGPPSSLAGIVNEHAIEVDVVTWTRRDLECLMEALYIARSTFSSRCYVQRIWGSTMFASLQPTPLETDYRLRIQTTATAISNSSSSNTFESSGFFSPSASATFGGGKSAFESSFNASSTATAAAAPTGAATSAASIFVSLHRMTQARVAFLSADDIAHGSITEETLSDVASSAHLLLLWKFVAAATTSTALQHASGVAGLGAASATMKRNSMSSASGLSGLVAFGKGAWKSWNVVLSDSSHMPSYLSERGGTGGTGGGGATHMLLAATKEAQTWLSAYEATKKTFCAQMALSVTLLGSRVSFSTCQVPMAVAARMKRKQHSSNASSGSSKNETTNEQRNNSDTRGPPPANDVGSEANESNEPDTLALIHEEVFCSNADVVFLLTGAAHAETNIECLGFGINNITGAALPGRNSNNSINSNNNNNNNNNSSSSGVNESSSSFVALQDSPSPVSWIKLRDIVADSAAIAAGFPSSLSSLSVHMCSHSFLPSALGGALWRPPSSAACLTTAAANPVQQALVGNQDPKPHCVVVPIRRVPCTILGHPNPHQQSSSPSSSTSTSTSTSPMRGRQSIAIKPQQLVIQSIAIRLLAGVGEDVIALPARGSTAPTTTITTTICCQIVSPCMEPIRILCSEAKNITTSKVTSAPSSSTTTTSSSAPAGEEDSTSSELANSVLLFQSDPVSSSSSPFAAALFPVETITNDRVRLASDIMSLKLLNKNRFAQAAGVETMTSPSGNNAKKPVTIFGNFSLLNAAGLVPGDGETVRCVFRLFSVCDGASKLAGECKMFISMPARL